MIYMIYRKADGGLDCIPEGSRLWPAAEHAAIEYVDGTAIEAWGRLGIIERLEKEAKEPKKRGRKR